MDVSWCNVKSFFTDSFLSDGLVKNDKTACCDVLRLKESVRHSANLNMEYNIA